ncbi:MAG: hypothetical protein IH974_10970 [Myxococcales bacterium]|nr:hypothetical protein [Myxococcales bacterium]
MYANILLRAELQRDALLIPREAYIDSGTRKVVFVDIGGGKFQPREIQVGVEAEDSMVEVLHGLDEGEVVVTSGQFMLDAESNLKEAVAKMMEVERALTTRRAPKSSEVATHSGDHDPAADGEASSNTSLPADASFACPMEEHPDEALERDRPGLVVGVPRDDPEPHAALRRPVHEAARLGVNEQDPRVGIFDSGIGWLSADEFLRRTILFCEVADILQDSGVGDFVENADLGRDVFRFAILYRLLFENRLLIEQGIERPRRRGAPTTPLGILARGLDRVFVDLPKSDRHQLIAELARDFLDSSTTEKNVRELLRIAAKSKSSHAARNSNSNN